VILAAEFFLRFIHDKPLRGSPSSRKQEDVTVLLDKRMRIMIYGLIFNTTCLFIRAVYRTIELSDGWKGRIISTQLYFNVLDGAMVTMAIYTLNFTHPGFLLRDSLSDTRSSHPSLVPDEEKRQPTPLMSEKN